MIHRRDAKDAERKASLPSASWINHLSVMREGIMKLVNALEKLAPPQADESYCFAPSQRKAINCLTQRTLRLCGELLQLKANQLNQ